MYQYDSIDKTIVAERVEQFRDQVKRHLAGELSASDLQPLRLRNGLYMQIHAHIMHAYTHIYIYIYACIYAYLRAYTHICTHILVYARIYT